VGPCGPSLDLGSPGDVHEQQLRWNRKSLPCNEIGANSACPLDKTPYISASILHAGRRRGGRVKPSAIARDPRPGGIRDADVIDSELRVLARFAGQSPTRWWAVVPADRSTARRGPTHHCGPQGRGRVQQLRRIQQLRRSTLRAPRPAVTAMPPWPAMTPLLTSTRNGDFRFASAGNFLLRGTAGP